MSKAKELINLVEAKDITDLANDLSKNTKVSNIKKILSWSTPKEWNKILDAAEKKMKRRRKS